ncbi:DNA double-strand break repair Rad50 ATPase [Fusarium oxysporum f. sp. albedinis]|nr:DNA double-strand break repair Rad50 ATPase [Fusarium oxysporum f. sp. albedinis]
MKSLLSLALVSLTAIASGVDAIAPKCRCLPGDTCWPSDTGNVWSRFKKTVNGLLIKTVPIGSPCHDPNYDEEACTALQQAWRLPQTHIDSSSSVMQPYFANQSCDPFLAQSRRPAYIDIHRNSGPHIDIQISGRNYMDIDIPR